MIQAPKSGSTGDSDIGSLACSLFGTLGVRLVPSTRSGFWNFFIRRLYRKAAAITPEEKAAFERQAQEIAKHPMSNNHCLFCGDPTTPEGLLCRMHWDLGKGEHKEDFMRERRRLVYDVWHALTQRPLREKED
jgi:hypothetical protein